MSKSIDLVHAIANLRNDLASALEEAGDRETNLKVEEVELNVDVRIEVSSEDGAKLRWLIDTETEEEKINKRFYAVRVKLAIGRPEKTLLSKMYVGESEMYVEDPGGQAERTVRRIDIAGDPTTKYGQT